MKTKIIQLTSVPKETFITKNLKKIRLLTQKIVVLHGSINNKLPETGDKNLRKMLRLLWKLASGPQLFRIYRKEEIPSHSYEANLAEKLANGVLKWIRLCWTICTWTSPFLILILYRKGAFSIDGLHSLFSYGSSLFTLLITAHATRVLGRLTNREYCEFIRVLMTYEQNETDENRAKLSRYDFCFSAWPVDYHGPKFRSQQLKSSSAKVSMPLYILSSVCVRTFGIRLLYPGCVSMFQSLIGQALMDGREKLIEENKGVRTKIITSDGNVIDVMFFDRRNSNQEQGKIIVICSEGNAGFYEIGCGCTPLEAGYSVLTWNHPGFSGSTGSPLPLQEQCAIDSVIQYSINHLRFDLSDTVLFAWSIGGYTASWAAMTYPDVGSVVLDATFDNILPLAVARMPPSWRGLIELAIPLHLNLNNAELLCKYPGKILLIRRTKDEMITTSETGSLASNRGNNLLEILLCHRYPHLFNPPMTILQNWLSHDKNEQNVIWESLHTTEEECQEIVSSQNSGFPSELGKNMNSETKEKMIIYLARNHMIDYESTHCTPLPASYFRGPKY